MRELWAVVSDPKAKWRLTQLSAAITGVIAVNALALIRFNTWQGDIYDTFAKRDILAFWREVGVFMIIIAVLLCLGVAQTWCHEMLKVRLRQAITHDLLDKWLRPMRAVQLPLTSEMSVNPDQRIQDDAKRLSELSVDLGVGLIQSSLLLVAFIGVLWRLSSQVTFIFNGEPTTIPGYMVWSALAYSLIGSFLTWFVGRPLIDAHTDLRAKEADFRFSLVRINENLEAIALYRGEAQERRFLNAPVEAVLLTARRIANRLAGLTWVTGGYGWLAILAPLLLAAPGYFGGTLTLGGLMMVVGAFYQVQQALRWYVDRFPVIAEWRAMLTRVIGYRSTLEQLETLGSDVGFISCQTDVSGCPFIVLDDVSVFGPHGRITLNEPQIKIAPGERVLIEATPKSGKSMFMKALVGAWVWGRGTICLPPREHMMFLPQVPYIPSGTLRAALAYPGAVSAYTDEEVHKALERVKLGGFRAVLDEVKRWDKELTVDEQRRLVLGRMLLHRPQWVIQDKSMSELDEDSRELALSIFVSELANTAVVSIGRHDPSYDFYQRRFSLQTRLPGLRLPLHFQAEEPPHQVSKQYVHQVPVRQA